MVGLFLFAVLAPLEPWVAGKVILTLAGGVLLVYDLQRRAGVGRLDLPIAVLFGAALVATAFHRVPGVRFDTTPWLPTFDRGDGFLIWTCYGLAALVASRLTSEEVRRLLGWLRVAGLIIAGVGLAQTVDFLLQHTIFDPTNHVTPPGLGAAIMPALGTLGNPVFYGAWAVLWEAQTESPIVLLGVFSSLSRAAILGWFIAMVSRRRWLAFVGAGLAAVGVMAELHWHFDLGIRADLWRRAIDLIRARPWGYGANTFAVVYPGTYEPSWDNPHNAILSVAYNFGLVGALGYLWIWGAALRRAPERLRAGLIGCGIALLFSWGEIGLANWLWVMLGLAVCSNEALTPPGQRAITVA